MVKSLACSQMTELGHYWIVERSDVDIFTDFMLRTWLLYSVLLSATLLILFIYLETYCRSQGIRYAFVAAKWGLGWRLRAGSGCHCLLNIKTFCNSSAFFLSHSKGNRMKRNFCVIEWALSCESGPQCSSVSLTRATFRIPWNLLFSLKSKGMSRFIYFYFYSAFSTGFCQRFKTCLQIYVMN